MVRHVSMKIESDKFNSDRIWATFLFKNPARDVVFPVFASLVGVDGI
jgi:hypothetical protein